MKKTWPLKDLDCANCAAELETALSGVEGVESVRVDFMNQRLTLTAADSAFPQVTRRVVEKAAQVEPDCRILIEEKDAEKGAEKDEDEEAESRWLLPRVGAALVLMGAGLLTGGIVSIVLFVAAYLAAGYDVLLRAGKNILHGKVFDENFLMAVASIGAMVMGEYAEGVAVMAFYQVGEWFQDRAVGKSRASIASLMDIRPDYANLLRDGKAEQVSPEEVQVGDLILVKPGEKVPLDGVVTEGSSSLNTTALTGESLPRDVAPGESVISGCVNMTGLLTVRVTSVYAESTVARILDMVETSGEHKAATEKFITRFARIYTPAVCGAALLLAVVPSLVTGNWMEWIRRALTFLVISCPCALVISVPLSFFSGIGGASRKGVLIKGADYLELLSQVDTVVCDKTGTLTKGVFTVTAVHPEEASEEALLEMAALAESYSDHPISRSLQAAYHRAVDRSRLGAVEEIAGHGIKAMVDGKTVYAGNDKLMEQVGIAWHPCHQQGTIVHVAADGVYMGHIVISDVVKPTSAEAMAELKQEGVRRLVMLTGDRKAVGEAIGQELGMTEVHAELLPEDKVTQVERLLGDAQGKLAFVGDGINDAPVLRRADIGIAMGAMGSDAAIEAADVVLMDDDPVKLALAIRIARRTMKIARQNIIFALGVKAAVLVLGALGIASMWLAVFADVGVSMLAILNATRAMFVSK